MEHEVRQSTASSTEETQQSFSFMATMPERAAPSSRAAEQQREWSTDIPRQFVNYDEPQQPEFIEFR